MGDRLQIVHLAGGADGTFVFGIALILRFLRLTIHESRGWPFALPGTVYTLMSRPYGWFVQLCHELPEYAYGKYAWASSASTVRSNTALTPCQNDLTGCKSFCL